MKNLAGRAQESILAGLRRAREGYPSRGSMFLLLGMTLVVGFPSTLLSESSQGCPETNASRSQERLSIDNRFAIVRAIDYEHVVSRTPMPPSVKENEVVEIEAIPQGCESTGRLNEGRLRQLLANRGTTIHTNDLVEITGVEFKERAIIFAINGGGKKKKKWYQRIQVQAGPGTGSGTDPQVDTAPPPAPGGGEPARLGTWLVLKFSRPLPDLTPEQVKQLLAPVFDFSQRSATVPWIETIPEEFRKAIQEKRATVGMNREMVLAALGRPPRKVRETKNGVEREDWIYGNPPFVTFVTFVGDEVIEVREHN